MRTFLLILRWASVLGFFAIVVATVYGAYLLARMKHNMDAWAEASKNAMTERSTLITTALTEMHPKKEPTLMGPACNGD